MLKQKRSSKNKVFHINPKKEGNQTFKPRTVIPSCADFTRNSRFLLKKTFKNFMVAFHGWGSTMARLQSHYEETLLFTTKSPGVPGTHVIDHGRMKGPWLDEVSLEPPSGLGPEIPKLATQHFNRQANAPLLQERPRMYKKRLGIVSKFR